MTLRTKIFTALQIAPFLAFSQGLNLAPHRINHLTCFDSLQIRYIAHELKKGPLKDSIIVGQERQIKALEHSDSLKVKSIENLEGQLELKDDQLENKKLEVEKTIELADTEKKRLKDSRRKWIVIAAVEFVAIFLMLL